MALGLLRKMCEKNSAGMDKYILNLVLHSYPSLLSSPLTSYPSSIPYGPVGPKWAAAWVDGVIGPNSQLGDGCSQTVYTTGSSVVPSPTASDVRSREQTFWLHYRQWPWAGTVSVCVCGGGGGVSP